LIARWLEFQIEDAADCVLDSWLWSGVSRKPSCWLFEIKSNRRHFQGRLVIAMFVEVLSMGERISDSL
jgi:hypothetical protein